MEKIKKHKIITSIIIVLGFLCIFGFTYGKYVSDKIWSYYLESQGFYISSKSLGITNVKNVDTSWDGNAVSFNVSNSSNDNLITDYDINYKVSCSIEGDAASHLNCYLNGTNTSNITGTLSNISSCLNTTSDGVDVSSFSKTNCELKGYKWESSKATNTIYFSINSSDSTYTYNNVMVDVTLTTTSPYAKTITGTFNLTKDNSLTEGISSKYNSYSDYGRLNISNSSNSAKCVKVSWNPDDLAIDTDTSLLSSKEEDGNGYIKQITLSIKAKSSLSYIFYPKNFKSSYSINDFTITEEDSC